jgi:hypothetical protein
MGRETDIFSLYPETIALAAGATAIFSPIPGQIACTVKYVGGGTMAFIGSSQSFGSTLAQNNKYIITSGEIFNFDSAGQFSVEAQGATVIFTMVRSRSAGFAQT